MQLSPEPKQISVDLSEELFGSGSKNTAIASVDKNTVHSQHFPFSHRNLFRVSLANVDSPVPSLNCYGCCTMPTTGKSPESPSSKETTPLPPKRASSSYGRLELIRQAYRDKLDSIPMIPPKPKEPSPTKSTRRVSADEYFDVRYDRAE